MERCSSIVATGQVVCASGPSRRLVSALRRAGRAALSGGWSAVRDIKPEFWHNLRAELVAGRQWINRGVVLAYAALTGGLVIAFTLLAEAASHDFSVLRGAAVWAHYVALVWTPAFKVGLLWWTRRFVPGALGSGIPQVVRALDDDLQATQQSWLVSLRFSLHKIGLVSGAMLAGLSIGREGPTVQVGAGIVVHARRWLSPQSQPQAVQHPLRFAAGCAFMVAVIGIVTGGATAGAGSAPTRAMLEGQSELPGVFTLLKYRATWLLTWTGAPAGVFAPSLTIGAGIGRDISLLMGVGPETAIPLIALGMVGYLAAMTQGPITAFIIVMEMVSGQSMVLSLMACALLSSSVARLVARPMYSALAVLLQVPAAAGMNAAGRCAARPAAARCSPATLRARCVRGSRLPRSRRRCGRRGQSGRSPARGVRSARCGRSSGLLSWRRSFRDSGSG